MEYYWWLLIAVALVIIEVLSADLIFIMFAGGAVSATIVSLLDGPFILQVLVFAIVSVILLLFVRPVGKKLLARHTPNIRTNAQGLIGMQAVVRERVTAMDGRILLDGQVWSARSETEMELPQGTRVAVVEIDGATAVVAPLGEPVPTPPDRY
ncbi:MAG: NfeD family protein [Actinomycetaceae bacterium]|nr:NfeD family protein [Actinomycetaceae bacterium]